MSDAPETKVVIVGPERWSTFSVFNAHAFPKDLASVVDSCSLRLAVLLIHIKTLDQEVRRDFERFKHELVREDAEGLADSLISLRHRHQNVVAYYDGVGYMSALYGVLNTTKSFLDVYGLLMGKLIGRRLSWSFKRSTVDGTELSGGAIIKWLRKSAPCSLTVATPLADVIARHSSEWITEAVAHRDTISHYSEIKGFRHMSVPLLPRKPCFDEAAMSQPRMPGGRPLSDYVAFLQERIKAFVAETINKLPNLKGGHLTPSRLFIVE